MVVGVAGEGVMGQKGDLLNTVNNKNKKESW